MMYISDDGEHLYDEIEIITAKLKDGVELTYDEIEDLRFRFNEVYVEEGDVGRWSQKMTTVVKVDGVLYAIEWHEGLTEYQDDNYGDQPYKVKLENIEKLITKTEIVKL